MKRPLIGLLLWFPLWAHADEIGAQYLNKANAGDKRAQYYLADTYLSSGNEQQARFWAEKSANQGDADALALLAQIMMKTSYPRARQLAEQASYAGSKPGEITLARILINTQSGKPDYQQAINLLEDAAKNEESDSAVDAQMLLGMIYANGVSVSQDDEKATYWFKRSSALSRTGYAEYWAGMTFLQGESGFVEQNKQKALNWLNVSCNEGFDTGCEEFDKLGGG